MLGFPHVAIPAAVAELAAGLSAPAGGEVETLLLLASDGDEPEKFSIDHGRQLVGGRGSESFAREFCLVPMRAEATAESLSTPITRIRAPRKGASVLQRDSFQAPHHRCCFASSSHLTSHKNAAKRVQLTAKSHWWHRRPPSLYTIHQKSTVGCSTLSISDYRDSEIDTTTEIVVVCSTLSIGGDARDSHGFQPFQWKRSTPNKGFVLVPSNAGLKGFAAAHRLASTVGRGVCAGTSS